MKIPSFLLAFIPVFCLLVSGCTKLPNQEKIITESNLPKSFAHQKTLQSLSDTQALSKEKILQEKAKIQEDKKSNKGASKDFDTRTEDRAKDFSSIFFALFPNDNLKSIIQTALAQNTDLLTLESKIRQAAATAKINLAGIFPSASLDMDYNYSNRNYQNVQISFNQNALNANISLNWEVDLFGKLIALAKASKQTYLASIDSLKASQVSLIASVANYYFTIQNLKATLEIQQKISDNLKKILEITQKQYQLGLASIADLSSAKNSFLTQQNAILNTRYTLEQNQNALLVLLNAKNLPGIRNPNLTPTSIPQINALPQNTLILRPDVQNAIHTLYAALYTRTNKKLGLFPTISLNGSLGQLLFSDTSAVGLISRVASMIAMPLLNRQSITQTYLMAKEDVKQAYYSLQNTINTAISEVNNAAINLQTSKQTYRNAKDNFATLSRNFESSHVQYRQSLIDMPALLSVQNSFLNAKNAMIIASISLNLSLVAIYKALAGNINTPH